MEFASRCYVGGLKANNDFVSSFQHLVSFMLSVSRSEKMDSVPHAAFLHHRKSPQPGWPLMHVR